MAHRTKITSYEKPANNLFTVIIHCCGEHEHRHTVGPEVLNDPVKFYASVDWAHTEAAKNHAAAQAADSKLHDMVGTEQEHP